MHYPIYSRHMIATVTTDHSNVSLPCVTSLRMRTLRMQETNICLTNGADIHTLITKRNLQKSNITYIRLKYFVLRFFRMH